LSGELTRKVGKESETTLARDWSLFRFLAGISRTAFWELCNTISGEADTACLSASDGFMSTRPSARLQTLGLEGVVSKVRDSRYVSGRGRYWVKKTSAQRETLTIAGFAVDEGKWDGLYLGRRQGDDLVYTGKVCRGFDKTSNDLSLSAAGGQPRRDLGRHPELDRCQDRDRRADDHMNRHRGGSLEAQYPG
jgi:hypothetical protein